jgi:hypothetical protein
MKAGSVPLDLLVFRSLPSGRGYEKREVDLILDNLIYNYLDYLLWQREAGASDDDP